MNGYRSCTSDFTKYASTDGDLFSVLRFVCVYVSCQRVLSKGRVSVVIGDTLNFDKGYRTY